MKTTTVEYGTSHCLSGLITNDASSTLTVKFRLPWKRQHSEE